MDCMKYCYLLMFAFVANVLTAQVQVPGITQQILGELNSNLRRGSGEEVEKLQEKYPVYSIEGSYYLSMIGKVTEDFSISDLPEGVLLGTQIGDIVTLKVPLNNLELIQQLKSVDYVESAGKINPSITNAVKDMRADSVQMGLGFNSKYTGKNVIIGVTDWGFDYTHPMFYDTALQETRILASWDQFKLSGPAPAGKNYGAEYVGKTQLLAAKSDTACTYYDYATHGNHVAGIAGGSGAGIGLRGVAFESKFLFSAIRLDMGSVIDAVDWMKKKATAEGKRLVVNMSWGLYHLGPLDGTSLGSQAIDNFTDEGVVIVTSGGNNGDRGFHIKKDFNNDSVVTRVEFYDYNAHASMWGQSISMWGEKGKSFKAGFEVYSGATLLMKTPIYNTTTAASYLDSMLISGTDTVFFNLATDNIHPQSKRPHMRLRVKNTNNLLRVVLKSYAVDGTVHYWNVTELSNGAGNWGMRFLPFGSGSMTGDNKYGIGEPACAKKAISIGAHNSEFKLPTGTVLTGNLAPFSSEGPTLDGRIKPDVTAPGVNVASSISSFTTRSYTTFKSTNFKGRKYDFAKFSGTSMSGPAAAGVVALMLQANPQLTAAQVKDILKKTARQDDKTGAIPTTGSTEWGWGKVTATAAVKEAVKLVSVVEVTNNPEIAVYPNPVREVLRISNQNQELYQVKIFSIDGRLVKEANVRDALNVADIANGTYILYLQSEKEFSTIKFVKR